MLATLSTIDITVFETKFRGRHDDYVSLGIYGDPESCKALHSDWDSTY